MNHVQKINDAILAEILAAIKKAETDTSQYFSTTTNLLNAKGAAMGELEVKQYALKVLEIAKRYPECFSALFDVKETDAIMEHRNKLVYIRETLFAFAIAVDQEIKNLDRIIMADVKEYRRIIDIAALKNDKYKSDSKLINDHNRKRRDRKADTQEKNNQIKSINK